MLVFIYQDHGKRSKYLCEAMREGIERCGDSVEICHVNDYNGIPESDVAVFYGLKARLKQIFYDYKRCGKKAVLIDLGYWNRVEGGKLEGYHKVTVNDFYPTWMIESYRHDGERLKKLDLAIKPFTKNGNHILLAGMSSKSAWAHDMEAFSYEDNIVSELKKYTRRDIYYRQKPTCVKAKPIPGALKSNHKDDLHKSLKDCWAVVTHHSNVAIDAILEGIPAFTNSNAPAILVGKGDISEIEEPFYPSDEQRLQWVRNLSYMQWRPIEMRNGDCWEWYKQRGWI